MLSVFMRESELEYKIKLMRIFDGISIWFHSLKVRTKYFHLFKAGMLGSTPAWIIMAYSRFYISVSYFLDRILHLMRQLIINRQSQSIICYAGRFFGQLYV